MPIAVKGSLDSSVVSCRLLSSRVVNERLCKIQREYAEEFNDKEFMMMLADLKRCFRSSLAILALAIAILVGCGSSAFAQETDAAKPAKQEQRTDGALFSITESDLEGAIITSYATNLLDGPRENSLNLMRLANPLGTDTELLSDGTLRWLSHREYKDRGLDYKIMGDERVVKGKWSLPGYSGLTKKVNIDTPGARIEDLNDLLTDLPKGRGLFLRIEMQDHRKTETGYSTLHMNDDASWSFELVRLNDDEVYDHRFTWKSLQRKYWRDDKELHDKQFLQYLKARSLLPFSQNLAGNNGVEDVAALKPPRVFSLICRDKSHVQYHDTWRNGQLESYTKWTDNFDGTYTEERDVLDVPGAKKVETKRPDDNRHFGSKPSDLPVFLLVLNDEESDEEETDKEQMAKSIADDAFPHANPCDDPVFKRLANEEYSEEVRRKLESLKPRYNLQRLGSRGTEASLPYANYDRYSVTIPASRLPEGFDPRRELASWPADMNSVPKPGSRGARDFRSANRFEMSPKSRGPGDVIHISIGSGLFTYPLDVAVMITDQTASYFRVSTLEREVLPGRRVRHPVSGSREFGFTENRDGSVTFYTQGLDSPASIAANVIGGWYQESGWKGFMTGLGEKLGLTAEEAEANVNNGSFSNKNVDAKPDC